MLALSRCVYGREMKKMEEQSMKLKLPAESDNACSLWKSCGRERKKMEEQSMKLKDSIGDACLRSILMVAGGLQQPR